MKLDSKTKGMQGKTSRELLRLCMVRCHKELKIDKQISSFPLGLWQKAWHLYCEFGTRGVVLELRDHGGRCFEGSTMKDTGTFHWNDLLRATSLAREREIDQRMRVVASMTPPVQAPYLLKCVPDRVTDNSGAMICDLILRMNQYHPQEGRWLSRTVLDHAGRECFIVRMRYVSPIVLSSRTIWFSLDHPPQGKLSPTKKKKKLHDGFFALTCTSTSLEKMTQIL